MTEFLVFLAVAVAGLTALFAVGRPGRAAGARAADESGGSGGVADGGPRPLPGLLEPVAALPPVLLPDNPHAEDLHRIRFSLGLRGYRMDQVDEVLDRLADSLRERDALIGELRAELGRRQ